MTRAEIGQSVAPASRKMIESLRYSRHLAGVLLKDWWRYQRALRAPDESYLAICNRNERLDRAPEGGGYRCQWQWTSDLHAPKYLPALGLGLMRRALADHPFQSADSPEATTSSPEVSFIVGHRGIDRLPQLLASLRHIAGQRGAAVECIVVEQDTEPRVAGKLSPWVRHVHTPPPDAALPYCRSWAFNVGVQRSRGTVVVLHDNDMLVPADYAASVVRHVQSGHEVVNLKRFIFYLTQRHTRALSAAAAGLADEAPESVMQNSEGGGSIAITRDAYERIGGFDEAFIGWGGEDNEFWERAQTLRVWPYGHLPFVHLWHPPQAKKYGHDNPTLQRHRALAGIPVNVRIADLRNRQSGAMAGPAVASSSTGAS